jgi:rubrerythrin
MKTFILEAIESFLVTLGYGLIFYLLIKKLQKSWPILVITVSVFSLVVLSVWWDMFGIGSVDDAVGDITGIYLAVLAMVWLFHFNSLGLKTAPQDTPPLLRSNIKYTKKESMHLGRLLQVSILVEERGTNFYNNLEKRVANPDVKKICLKLATDGIRHKEFIEKNLFRWLPLTMNRQTLTLFEKELTISGIFLNPPSLDSSEQELIKYAIAQEETKANFYLSFEKAFPEPQRRMNIQFLAMEARAHASELIASYQKLKGQA